MSRIFETKEIEGKKCISFPFQSVREVDDIILQLLNDAEQDGFLKSRILRAEKEIVFDTDQLVSLAEMPAGELSPEQLIHMLEDLSNMLAYLEDSFIGPEYVSFDARSVFIDPETEKLYLTVLPLQNPGHDDIGMQYLIKYMINRFSPEKSNAFYDFASSRAASGISNNTELENLIARLKEEEAKTPPVSEDEAEEFSPVEETAEEEPAEIASEVLPAAEEPAAESLTIEDVPDRTVLFDKQTGEELNAALAAAEAALSPAIEAEALEPELPPVPELDTPAEEITREPETEEPAQETPEESEAEESAEETPVLSESVEGAEETPAEPEVVDAEEEAAAEPENVVAEEEIPAEVVPEEAAEEIPALPEAEEAAQETPAEAEPGEAAQETPAEPEAEEVPEEVPAQPEPAEAVPAVPVSEPAREMTAYLFRKKSSELVQLSSDPFVIGKIPAVCDYVITDNPALSRIHAIIRYVEEEEAYFIIDCNSTNHVYVNGVRVSGQQFAKLADKDRIHLATEAFVFHLQK